MKKGRVTKMAAALQLVKQQSTLRPRDLSLRQIPLDYLNRLYRKGLVCRLGRGVYAWPNVDVSENHGLAEAARRAPKGVICLLSALRFHNLTTQLPHQIWLALPSKAWSPRVQYPRLRIMWYSGPALSELIEEHKIEGTLVKIYSPAKTVADCFKFRNKVGLDVALEALRDCWRTRRANMDELWEAARICRMTNVMRPYLESLI